MTKADVWSCRLQGGWVEESGCGLWLWKMATFRQVAGEEELLMPALALSKAKKGPLWRSFSSVTLIAADCLPTLFPFIYRMVPHNELSNVLWTVNFPNAVLCPSSTLAYKAHTHNCSTPEVIMRRKHPQFYSVLRHQSVAFVWKERMKEIWFPWCPCILLKPWWKAVKLPSPINQAWVSQNCLQAQLIKQWAEHAKVI